MTETTNTTAATREKAEHYEPAIYYEGRRRFLITNEHIVARESPLGREYVVAGDDPALWALRLAMGCSICTLEQEYLESVLNDDEWDDVMPAIHEANMAERPAYLQRCEAMRTQSENLHTTADAARLRRLCAEHIERLIDTLGA